MGRSVVAVASLGARFRKSPGAGTFAGRHGAVFLEPSRLGALLQASWAVSEPFVGRLFGPRSGSFQRLWTPFGCLVGPRGRLLKAPSGVSEGFLGANWSTKLDASVRFPSLEQLWVFVLMEKCETHLGGSWAVLGLTWENARPSWSGLGGLLDGNGASANGKKARRQTIRINAGSQQIHPLRASLGSLMEPSWRPPGRP